MLNLVRHVQSLDLINMKTLITTALLILSVLVAQAQLAKTHDTERFTIQYPESWNIDQSGQMGMTFAVFSEQEGSNDLFKENVNLVEQDLSGYNMNLDQYMDLNLSQLKSMITNYELKSSNRISGSPEYHKLIYIGNQGQYNLTFEQYFWVVGTQAYVLTFTSEQNQFDNYKDIGESILNSFQIK